MTDPAPIADRQPSPGVQPSPLSLPTPVAEASNNAIEAEPLPPVHEEDEQLQLQHQHEHEHEHHQLLPELQPQQPPPFQPLFTLVTDSTTRATHHPRVHYIFSDDDPDILTEALAHYGPQKQQNTLSSPSGSGTTLEARDRPRQPSTASITTPNNERVIILDLVPKANTATTTTTTATTAHSDEHSAAAATAASAGGGGGGYDVAWASSLSSDWAVVSARISPMADDINASSTGAGPNAAGDPDGENNPQQQQLILRIEGLGLDAVAPSRAPGTRARRSSTATATGAGAGAAGRRPSIEDRGDLRMSGSSGAAPQGQGQGQERGREDYAAIMDEFDRRMGVLRKVVDAGMERQRRLAADEEDTAPEGLPSGTHTHDWGLEQGGVGGSFVQQQQQQRQGRAVSAASMRPSEGGE